MRHLQGVRVMIRSAATIVVLGVVLIVSVAFNILLSKRQATFAETIDGLAKQVDRIEREGRHFNYKLEEIVRSDPKNIFVLIDADIERVRVGLEPIFGSYSGFVEPSLRQAKVLGASQKAIDDRVDHILSLFREEKYYDRSIRQLVVVGVNLEEYFQQTKFIVAGAPP